LKPKYVEELEARTRAAEQTTKDVQARFEQVRAELKRETDEIRQRLTRTADERAAREKAAFVGALLPVMENLQRAMEAAESGGSLEALLNGLRGTISGFESAITSAGIEPVTAIGAPFDPELHEAVDTIEVEAERDGIVTAEYGRGYRMGGQLLRPARVQVGRAKPGRRRQRNNICSLPVVSCPLFLLHRRTIEDKKFELNQSFREWDTSKKAEPRIHTRTTRTNTNFSCSLFRVLSCVFVVNDFLCPMSSGSS
jgi:molecular chaperone GrpE